MIFSDKTQPQTPPQSEVKLIPVLKADQLLSNLRSQPWLKQIKGYVDLPDPHFEALYVSLIERFSEFVQILPATTEGKLGNLLSESLARAILATKTAYESDPDKFKQEPRYAYAIFSASLLLNIGAITNSKVTLSDKDGRFLADWLPYHGSLVGKGQYYKIHRYLEVPAYLHRHVTTILARQLMPELGFSWLAEDARLFHMWLALLNGDRASASVLDFILAFTMEEIEELLKSLESSEELDLLPVEEEIILLQAPEIEEAENFLQWLKEEIENGNIVPNGSDERLIVLSEGVFVSMELFRQFCSSFSSQYFTVVVKAFNHLGLTQLSGSDYRSLQWLESARQSIEQHQKTDFTSESSKSSLGFLKHSATADKTTSHKAEQTGVLLKDASLLLKESVAPVQSARVSPPATQLDKLPQLESPMGVALSFKMV